MPDHAAQLAYCQEHMLPIWERWADGNMVLRMALACHSADPQVRANRYKEFSEALADLSERGATPALRAAVAAGKTAQYALVGVSLELVRHTGRHAIVLDHDAVRDQQALERMITGLIVPPRVEGGQDDGHVP